MYKKCAIFFAFIITGFLQVFLNAADYNIVFIHIGNKLPQYAEIALRQARSFNPECPIILLSSKSAIRSLSHDALNANITTIDYESLARTTEHARFIQRSTLDNHWREGFWRCTSERFLYLNDLMTQYGLKNVFHMEYDNMLYANLEELLPIFQTQYKGIAATFDNDKRCIAGFIFIPNPQRMKRLANSFANHASKKLNDMELIALFKKENGYNAIDHLPIVHEEYVQQHALISPTGHKAQNKAKYCQNIHLFHSIFDAAAIGQYLGGIDPSNGNSTPGFINESCVFNPSLLSYEWIRDSQGRKVPYAVYNGIKYRINNLHIHSKQLHEFAS
ncbi:MAG TPA: hypothetical protein VLG49_00405 [Rhabdochlamydiaceae bacterium]|nr:hypothetical protein [Rhabdochlamydiaceae bacterium]